MSKTAHSAAVGRRTLELLALLSHHAAPCRDAVELTATASDRYLPPTCGLFVDARWERRGLAANTPLKSDFLPRLLSVSCNLRHRFSLTHDKIRFLFRLKLYFLLFRFFLLLANLSGY